MLFAFISMHQVANYKVLCFNEILQLKIYFSVLILN